MNLRLSSLLCLPLALVCAISGPGVARAASYVIDKDNTLVGFAWERAGLSRQQGRFNEVAGTVEFEPEAPETGSVDVTVRTASVSTGVAAFDRNLRSPDFFDAASFPVMTFKSTAVTKTGEKTGEVTGDLSILGVSKPVTLQVTWIFSGEHPFGKMNAAYRDRTVAVFSAKGVIKRSDWGLTRVIPLISDEITLSIEAELLKK